MNEPDCTTTPRATWHHGLMARWWSEVNLLLEELAYYRGAIERFGEPALDLGCGTGRLLVGLLEAGLDVDGVDVSADMLATARAVGDAAGMEMAGRLAARLSTSSLRRVAPATALRSWLLVRHRGQSRRPTRCSAAPDPRRPRAGRRVVLLDESHRRGRRGPPPDPARIPDALARATPCPPGRWR